MCRSVSSTPIGRRWPKIDPGAIRSKMIVLHALLRAQAASLLLQDDLPLLVDLRREQREPRADVGEEREGLLERLGLVVGHLERVRRLVEAREGVLVASERQTHALEEGDHRAGREVLGAVEGHVLEVVRDPALLVGLVERAGGDVQVERRAIRRHRVTPHDVLQPVVQLTGHQPLIGREGLGLRRTDLRQVRRQSRRQHRRSSRQAADRQKAHHRTHEHATDTLLHHEQAPVSEPLNARRGRALQTRAAAITPASTLADRVIRRADHPAESRGRTGPHARTLLDAAHLRGVPQPGRRS
jgi:hypothetical protein